MASAGGGGSEKPNSLELYDCTKGSIQFGEGNQLAKVEDKGSSAWQAPLCKCILVPGRNVSILDYLSRIPLNAPDHSLWG